MEKLPTTGLEGWTPQDIADELAETEPELLKYMRLLPAELWKRHFTALQKIEREHGGEGGEAVAERRINYILNIVETREQAIVNLGISEPVLQDIISASPDGTEMFGTRLRELLVSQGNFLGAGTTARVKAMQVEGFDRPIAVKYLLTPTAKTLSAEGEYDMLREVETITQIEDAEGRLGAGEYMRVPHPFFHYKRGKLQCYGMSQVNGITLEELAHDKETMTPVESAVAESLRERFASEAAREALREEVDVFMRAVHEVCLHGDIKFKNIMIDEQGMLYLIDFGQSVPMRSMAENTRDQFDNLQDNERMQMHECIRHLWNHLRH